MDLVNIDGIRFHFRLIFFHITRPILKPEEVSGQYAMSVEDSKLFQKNIYILIRKINPPDEVDLSD